MPTISNTRSEAHPEPTLNREKDENNLKRKNDSLSDNEKFIKLQKTTHPDSPFFLGEIELLMEAKIPVIYLAFFRICPKYEDIPLESDQRLYKLGFSQKVEKRIYLENIIYCHPIPPCMAIQKEGSNMTLAEISLQNALKGATVQKKSITEFISNKNEWFKVHKQNIQVVNNVWQKFIQILNWDDGN